MNKNYSLLFNAVTDLITDLESLRNRLIAIQQTAEEMYISSEPEYICAECSVNGVISLLDRRSWEE